MTKPKKLSVSGRTIWPSHLRRWERPVLNLGAYQDTVDRALEEIAKNKIISRIWAHDHTVWKPEPTEIANRLGWLHLAPAMTENVEVIEKFVKEVREQGYRQAVLLGMGGDSLGPRALLHTFGVKDGYLNLSVLDSTVPGAVLDLSDKLDPAETLFIVSTKSGTTPETLALFKYFHNWVVKHLGAGQAGDHFAALADSGNDLHRLAKEHHFRATFLSDVNIGGRYSVLSYYGLIPAGIIGVDLRLLLDRASRMARNSEARLAAPDNPSAVLGAVLGELARVGRDKATIIASPEMAGLGGWLEQLLAESTGKEGKGILPVVNEPVGPLEVYGDDRVFIHFRLDHDDQHDKAFEKFSQAGHPVVTLRLHDRYDLGGQFFLWEMATAVTGALLKVNPFDQPNVESAKVRTREMVALYTGKGKLPQQKPTLKSDGLELYGDLKGDDLSQVLKRFVDETEPGSYLAIQAYLQPSDKTSKNLKELQLALRDKSGLATTVGFGPSFLHSTGQLHKGDAGKGIFIQLTATDPRDAPIPDQLGSPGSVISFGVFKMAQVLGDQQALVAAGRKVIRIHLTEVNHGLQTLISLLS